MANLVAPNVFLQWSSNAWAGAPRAPDGDDDASPDGGGYLLEWQSSTAPPVVCIFFLKLPEAIRTRT